MAKSPRSISNRLQRAFALVLPVLTALFFALGARAEDAAPESVQTAAESLFLEGRRLLAAGKIEEACQRFEDSRRIEPALGTTMNLARCYLKLGRTASAWLLYRDTAAIARGLGQADREQHALHELRQLEPDLAKVVIELEPALIHAAKVVVLLDGTAMPKSAIGSELPLDPGVHEVTVQASEQALWSTKVTAIARNSLRVKVPHLELPKELVVASAPPVRAAPGAPPSERSRSWVTTRRSVALVLAGAAVLATSFTIYETLQARSENGRSHPDSCVPGALCTASDVRYRQQAFESARLASVGAAAAGASLIGAGVLWFYGAPVVTSDTSSHVGFSGQLGYRRTF